MAPPRIFAVYCNLEIKIDGQLVLVGELYVMSK